MLIATPPPLAMTTPEQLMRQYAERLLQLRGSLSQRPTAADLEKIALDVGLTSTDLETLRQRAQDHVTRAEGYAEFRRWDDAIAELEQAVELEPLNLDILYFLADGYRQRYQKRGQGRDRTAADALARQCLHLEPSHRAAMALRVALDQPRGLQKWVRLPKAKLTILVLVGVGGLGSYQLWYDRQPHPTPRPAVTHPPEPSATPEPIIASPTPPTTGTQELEIPVELVVPPKLKGLSLQQTTSRLTNYPSGKSFYTVQTLLVNESDQELAKVSGRLALLDDQGQVLESESRSLLDTYQAPLRPGDRHAWDWLTQTPATVRAMRLQISTVEATPAAARHAASPTIELRWDIAPPADLQLQVQERRSTTRKYGFGEERLTHIAILAFTNTGNEPVQRLKVQIRRYDETGQALEHHDRYVVTHQVPPLLPGASRLLQTLMTDLPLSFERYEVAVIEIE